ncbi:MULTISPECIES: hydroxyisourate hydrolase [Vibrio]|nr:MULTISPECIES: hydroxyisourate hydrolase [Vibrio]NAW57298.1 hydroxyisourate hydrolase [Vibrio sp. V36_P2S2PM302]NAX23839.1 hydroxyisourate hydrolase [Vibrio sp. V39_P1S14PM300]NAX25284.1 hydroxyisourate hydrolase [Vibrio sp. V38_P2S17PM301]NAX29738.1 hydroxyisourate hydrolase [Vibrio sp. V37_P2S8PM304]
MGKLTTHVLDTMHGTPGAEIKVELHQVDGSSLVYIKDVTTNFDGRTDSPMLEGNEFVAGKYQLTFYVADYYRAKGVDIGDIAFLDDVVIRFGISEDSHYHVPLLVSPYSFSTYRGS